MFLVLMGCGSAVFAGDFVGYLGISFAFGLTVLVLAYAIGPVSGCHVNPAITTAMVINRGMDKKEAAGYIISQFIGAALGALIIYVIASNFFSNSVSSLGQNGFGGAGGYSWISAFIAETVFSALFVIVVLGATSPKANVKFAGIAIGLALVLIHIVSIPITGTSVNPARSFGPALFSLKALSQLWLFITAPIAGAFLGAYLWKVLSPEKSDKTE
jgi:aquaporin Z